MKKIIKEELNEAIQNGDPLQIGAVIVYWGNSNLVDAKEAFDYAVQARVKGFPEEHDPSQAFTMDESQWDERYFDQHTHQMRKNFSKKSFEHYLAVGRKVFPHKLRREQEDDGRKSHGSVSPYGHQKSQDISKLIIPIGCGVLAILGLLYLLLRK